MKCTKVSVLAMIAMSASSALAAGTATIVNQCSYDVYVWSVVVKSGVAPMQKVPAGGSCSEEYREAPEGGISMKVTKTTSQEDPAQFEYTIGGGTIFYDLSLIDGNPFGDEGMIMTPSDPSCFTVDCPAGQYCPDAYQHPDDVCTHGCDLSTDVTLTLCPGLGGQPAGGASSSSEAPTPTTTSTTVPTSTSTEAPSPTTTTTTEAAPTTTTLVTSTTPSATPTEEASPQELAEEPTSTPSAATWHSVSKRRGHSHGHRFARP